MTMRELCAAMNELGYSAYRIPKLGLDNGFGNGIVRLASYFQPKGVRSYLRTNLDRIPSYDNSKIKSALALEFRPLRESIGDTLEDLLRWQHVARKAA
jgi:dihydroflavonol-4-reductase